MKKILLAMSVVMAGLCAKAFAVGPQWGVPEGDSQQIIQTADYGGVQYATSAFSANVTTVTLLSTPSSTDTVRGRSVVYGVIFSSGVCGADFVDVYDATTTVTLVNRGSATNADFQPTARFYNVSGSTSSSVAQNSACSGESGPKRPLRFKNGLLFKPSTNAYNMITLEYWKEER